MVGWSGQGNQGMHASPHQPTPTHPCMRALVTVRCVQPLPLDLTAASNAVCCDNICEKPTGFPSLSLWFFLPVHMLLCATERTEMNVLMHFSKNTNDWLVVWWYPLKYIFKSRCDVDWFLRPIARLWGRWELDFCRSRDLDLAAICLIIKVLLSTGGDGPERSCQW